MKGISSHCETYMLRPTIGSKLGLLYLLIDKDPDDLDEYIYIPKIVDGVEKWSSVSINSPRYHYQSSRELTYEEKVALNEILNDEMIGTIKGIFDYQCSSCKKCPHLKRVIPEHFPDYTQLPPFTPDGKDYSYYS